MECILLLPHAGNFPRRKTRRPNLSEVP